MAGGAVLAKDLPPTPRITLGSQGGLVLPEHRASRLGDQCRQYHLGTTTHTRVGVTPQLLDSTRIQVGSGHRSAANGLDQQCGPRRPGDQHIQRRTPAGGGQTGIPLQDTTANPLTLETRQRSQRIQITSSKLAHQRRNHHRLGPGTQQAGRHPGLGGHRRLVGPLHQASPQSRQTSGLECAWWVAQGSAATPQAGVQADQAGQLNRRPLATRGNRLRRIKQFQCTLDFSGISTAADQLGDHPHHLTHFLEPNRFPTRPAAQHLFKQDQSVATTAGDQRTPCPAVARSRQAGGHRPTRQPARRGQLRPARMPRLAQQPLESQGRRLEPFRAQPGQHLRIGPQVRFGELQGMNHHAIIRGPNRLGDHSRSQGIQAPQCPQGMDPADHSLLIDRQLP